MQFSWVMVLASPIVLIPSLASTPLQYKKSVQGKCASPKAHTSSIFVHFFSRWIRFSVYPYDPAFFRFSSALVPRTSSFVVPLHCPRSQVRYHSRICFALFNRRVRRPFRISWPGAACSLLVWFRSWCGGGVGPRRRGIPGNVFRKYLWHARGLGLLTCKIIDYLVR